MSFKFQIGDSIVHRSGRSGTILGCGTTSGFYHIQFDDDYMPVLRGKDFVEAEFKLFQYKGLSAQLDEFEELSRAENEGFGAMIDTETKGLDPLPVGSQNKDAYGTSTYDPTVDLYKGLAEALWPSHDKFVDHIINGAAKGAEQGWTREYFGTASNECSHQWVTYDSGFISFEYCQHCNTKKA